MTVLPGNSVKQIMDEGDIWLEDAPDIGHNQT